MKLPFPEGVPASATGMHIYVSGFQRSEDMFKFLSVFKWEQRKGWDLLLDAFFSEFTVRDKVTLYIHTYLYLVLLLSFWYAFLTLLGTKSPRSSWHL